MGAMPYMNQGREVGVLMEIWKDARIAGLGWFSRMLNVSLRGCTKEQRWSMKIPFYKKNSDINKSSGSKGVEKCLFSGITLFLRLVYWLQKSFML